MTRIGAVRFNPEKADGIGALRHTKMVIENGEEVWATFGPMLWTIPGKELIMRRRDIVEIGTERATWNYYA